MLKDLFPKTHVRFSSLPLLGSIADSFTEWLQQQGYRRRCSRILLNLSLFERPQSTARSPTTLCNPTPHLPE
jgi:hypothetical protein